MRRIAFLAIATTILALVGVWTARTYLKREQRDVPQPRGFPAGVAQEYLTSPPPGESTWVSLVALLARPQEFDGRNVQVVGFGHLEFKGDALYLHREDLTANLVSNSVRLDIPSRTPFVGFNDRYVIVEGVFVAAKGSGVALRPGIITKISRYDPLPSHSEMEQNLRPQQ